MIIMPAKTKIIAIHPTSLSFSLKNITASKTEKNTSPFAISAASDALACVNPTKYRLGAITAPQTAMDRININVETDQIIPILVLGSVGFAASLYFFLQGLKRIGTVRTITIFSMSSVFGLVAAGVFLAEQISWYQIMAAGIMILGVYLVSRKETVISPV